MLNEKLLKGTMSYWFRNLRLPVEAQQRLNGIRLEGLRRARDRARELKMEQRKKRIAAVRERVQYLEPILRDRAVAKIAISMLYLGEGTKSTLKGAVEFSNSDPRVVMLFLRLLRECFSINEQRIHYTVQCRADQDIESLAHFWSAVTGIPKVQAYKPQVDPRTVGRPTRRLEYKGVCRINYPSSEIFTEIMQIIDVLEGP